MIIPYDDVGEILEKVWLQGAASNPVFEDLNVPEEDVYTLKDGKLFHG